LGIPIAVATRAIRDYFKDNNADLNVVLRSILFVGSVVLFPFVLISCLVFDFVVLIVGALFLLAVLIVGVVACCHVCIYPSNSRLYNLRTLSNFACSYAKFT